jgi:hypothetical protein
MLGQEVTLEDVGQIRASIHRENARRSSYNRPVGAG